MRVRLLRRPTPPWPAIRRVARRRPMYGEPVIRLLAEIWEAAGYLCGPRRKAAIPHWLPWLQRRATVTLVIEAQVRRIVPGRSIGDCEIGRDESSSGYMARRGRARCSSTGSTARRSTGMSAHRAIWRSTWSGRSTLRKMRTQGKDSRASFR